jgi:hypothetical protein
MMIIDVMIIHMLVVMGLGIIALIVLMAVAAFIAMNQDK